MPIIIKTLVEMLLIANLLLKSGVKLAMEYVGLDFLRKWVVNLTSRNNVKMAWHVRIKLDGGIVSKRKINGNKNAKIKEKMTTKEVDKK